MKLVLIALLIAILNQELSHGQVFGPSKDTKDKVNPYAQSYAPILDIVEWPQFLKYYVTQDMVAWVCKQGYKIGKIFA